MTDGKIIKRMPGKLSQPQKTVPRPLKDYTTEQLKWFLSKRLADLAIMQYDVDANRAFTKYDRKGFQSRISDLMRIGAEFSRREIPFHFDTRMFSPKVVKVIESEMRRRGFTKLKPAGHEIKPKPAGRKIKPPRKRRLLK